MLRKILLISYSISYLNYWYMCF